MNEKRRALGRGLGALIPTAPGAARPVDVFFRERPEEPAHSVASRATEHPEHSERTSSAGPHGTPLQSSSPIDRPGPGSAGPGSDGPLTDRSSGERRDDAHLPGDGTASVVDEGHLAPVPGAVFAELPISAIRPNPRQPRTVFDEEELAELAASIREIGVLQPVVVRRITIGRMDAPNPAERRGRAGADGRDSSAGPATDSLVPREDPSHVEEGVQYELVMGERRLRASRLAGAETIPAIVKETTDDALLRDALLENLHRSQLNPLEEAAAYQQLLDDFGCSHEELATRIGRSRPQISNTIRLLRLPPLVARRLAAGVLSAGHARALLGVDDGAAMERLAQRVVAEGLSVRSLEEIVALGGDEPAGAAKPSRPRPGSRHPQLEDVAARLSDRLDTRVSIVLGQRKGRLTVEFASVEDLTRIVDIIERRTTPDLAARAL